MSLYKQLCFYRCVLLILYSPALIFSHFQDEKQTLALSFHNAPVLSPYWAVDGDYIYRGLTEDSATMVRNLITSQIA